MLSYEYESSSPLSQFLEDVRRDVQCDNAEVVDEEDYGVSDRCKQGHVWRTGRTFVVDDAEYIVQMAKSPTRLF